MAPEQLEGVAVDELSDIYSAGLVLYELATGQRPNATPTNVTTQRDSHSSQVVSPSRLASDIDPNFEDVIIACLQANPARRPQSALAAAAALPGSNMLMVYPPKQRRRWSEHSVTGVFVNIVESTFSNLYALELESDQPKALRFKSDAKEIWIKFFNEHGNEQFHLSGDLASAWSKLEGYVARFALIIELSKWASKEKASAPPKYISVDSIESAIKLGRWFCRETERVYSIFGRNQHSPSVERDIKNVVQSDGPITERDISRRLGAIDKDVIERTLYQMVERRILKREDSPAGAPGRPTCSYTINEADFIDETPENGGYDEVLTSLMAKHVETRPRCL